jgi:hypothetical protein
MRSRNLLIPEVLCRYCGAQVPSGRKFCNAECYRQKRLTQPIEQRFWSKVDRSGECWLWTGGAWNSGYGQFRLSGQKGQQKTIGAHQYSYQLAHGRMPDGLEVMHSCDTPLCVRPDHLRAGTHLQNVRDAAAKGHYRVPRPTRQKLTATQVQEIRSLVAAGELRYRVADRYGITKAYVTRIMAGTARPYDAPLEVVA